MHNLHLAICDDEAPQRAYLRALVTDWATRNQINAQISTFASAEDFTDGSAPNSFDILLLDIQMDGQDGVTLARTLRRHDERLIIIFITGLPDFAREGYDVDAFHYLLKPVDEGKLFAVLDKAVARFSKHSPTLLLPVDGAQMRVAIANILYIESFAHTVDMVLTDGTLTVKMPISKLEAMLGDTFIRCHRSYIANIARITKITRSDVFFENGKCIPLSRRLYSAVNKAFIACFKGTMGALP